MLAVDVWDVLTVCEAVSVTLPLWVSVEVPDTEGLADDDEVTDCDVLSVCVELNVWLWLDVVD